MSYGIVNIRTCEIIEIKIESICFYVILNEWLLHVFSNFETKLEIIFNYCKI